MGWFSKKKKDESDEIPSLPELPSAPKIPESKVLTEIPSLPSSLHEEKISSDVLKDAISGKQKPFGDFKKTSDEFQPSIESPMQKISVPEFQENPERIKKFMEKEKGEPLFVRIDKFEESLRIINKVKDTIEEIELALEDVKKIKEDEKRELDSWEDELKKTKDLISKIDKDLFSKIR
jgi:hypothetical protein